MLTVLTSQPVRPEVEAIDRDPGILTLVSGLVRIARGGVAAAIARFRAYHQVANEAELFSSATAWPYKGR